MYTLQGNMNQKSQPLPEVEGPRLPPFPNHHTIEFLQYLGYGLTAHVFKARINGQIYALKVVRIFKTSSRSILACHAPVTHNASRQFKYEKIYSYWIKVSDEYRDKVDLDLLTAHMHPFYSECRAYGRLKELGKEHLAARCYGYLHLSPNEQKDMEKLLGPCEDSESDPGRSTDEEDSIQIKDHFNRPDPDNTPLQVLVKEYIPGTVNFEAKHARKMVRDTKELHRCGIFVMDIKQDAYLDGILVDFSHAYTLPHIKFDPQLGFDPYKQGNYSVWADIGNLGEIFWDYNNEREFQDTPKIKVDPLPDFERLASLRGKDENPFETRNYVFLTDPSILDWRKTCQRAKAKEKRSARLAAGKGSKTETNGSGQVSKTRSKRAIKSTRGRQNTAGSVTKNNERKATRRKRK